MLGTERLRIRRLGPADFDAMFAVYGDPEAMRYVDDGLPIEAEACRQWIEVTERNYAARGYGMFAVEARGTGEVIGFCGLVHPGGQETPELKYAYLKTAWGKGYATEAAIALLAYGRSVHGMTQIIATTAPENTPSHRVLEKAGMRDAGTETSADGERMQVFESTG